MRIKTCQCEPFQSCERCTVDLSKPGKKVKNQPKSKRFLIHNIEKPEDRRCRNCGHITGTENYHHAESSRIKFISGGGITGGKISDRLTAWLCDKQECGIRFDTKPTKQNPGSTDSFETVQHDLFSYDMIIKTWLLKDT